MATAIENIEGPLRHPRQLFIDGKWTSPCEESWFDVINPATEELYYRMAESSAADVDRAVQAARHAFDHGEWPQLSHAQRATYLRAIGASLRRRAEQAGQIWTREMGILESISVPMVSHIASLFDEYAKLSESFQFEERHTPEAGAVGLLVREPVGVVGAIIPWNAPILLIAHKLAPALLAGCTVILKASPEAPGHAYLMAEIAEEIGLPPGVLNVLTADRTASETLVRHSGVDKISFTGSTAVGRRIGAICGERIARMTLELGGKSAAVVLDDFDIESAAQAIAGPACLMTGQVCASLTRIIVRADRQDALTQALAACFAQVRVGDPSLAETQMGPLAFRRHFKAVEQFIAHAQTEGGRLVIGGRRPAHLTRGFFIEPTVIANVDNRSTIARQEVFGPVVSIIPVSSEMEAIEVANDSIYGLNASIFTNDADRAYRLARRIRAGTVGHNAFRVDFGIGFGGFKQSGVGREGGREGLLSFLESKTIVLDHEIGDRLPT
jgi:aldehyde dehydrogenase (NAD+)